MNVLDAVNKALASKWLQPRWSGRQVAVPTSCLYPSGDWICVFVDGGEKELVVHDDGGALWEAQSAGIDPHDPSRHFRSIARRYGINVNKRGALIAKHVSPKDLAPIITLVANASQEASLHLYKKYKVESFRNVRQQLTKFLEERFYKKVIHDQKILGHSNKQHRFDHVIALDGENRIVVDFASNDANSINAKVVAHYDVREAHHGHLAQRIVYDDAEDWAASNLSLLEVGAPVVPYSSLPTVIDKLTAQH